MTTWQETVSIMLNDLTKEHRLPEGALYLSDNKAQKENSKTVSFSVCIWEPDYPRSKEEARGQNKIITTIVPSTVKSRPDDLDLLLREVQEKDLHEFVPEDAQVMPQTKSDLYTGTIKIRFNKWSPGLVDFIRRNAEYCIQNYVSKAARFACCSKFELCSDAKRCLHENLLYSKSCMYRENLEQGRIFYGKNRNID